MIQTVYCFECEKAYSVGPLFRVPLMGCPEGHEITGQPIVEPLASFKIGDSWEKLTALVKTDHIRISADFRRTEKDVSRLQNYIDQHGLFVARTQIIDAGRIRDELRDEQKKIFDMFGGIFGPATDSESPAE